MISPPGGRRGGERWGARPKRPPSGIVAVPDTVLAVLVRCHHLVCALPAAHVRRLVLSDEVERETHAGIACARVGGARFAAWELGPLLGLPVTPAAWVLLDLPRGRAGSVAVALATGPCLAVQNLGRGIELPAPLFRDRPAAFPAVFPMEQTRIPATFAAFGLWIAPEALLGPGELAAAEAASAAP